MNNPSIAPAERATKLIHSTTKFLQTAKKSLAISARSSSVIQPRFMASSAASSARSFPMVDAEDTIVSRTIWHNTPSIHVGTAFPLETILMPIYQAFANWLDTLKCERHIIIDVHGAYLRQSLCYAGLSMSIPTTVVSMSIVIR